MEQDKYVYEYPRPAVSADCVIFGFAGSELKVLLIERLNEPYKGFWSFPGGFLEMDENTDECAMRELREETSLNDVPLTQFYTFSDVDRDPRGRVITVGYIGLINFHTHHIQAGDDAARAKWFNTKELPILGFDHNKMYQIAIEYLKMFFTDTRKSKIDFSSFDHSKLSKAIAEL